MAKRKASVRSVAVKLGFRSGFEKDIHTQIKSRGLEPQYETTKIKYVIPESSHTYTPDFVLPNGIIVETKGRFLIDDRKKHLLIRAQHPGLDIRLLFQNSNVKMNKGSKTTYADWCVKNNFIYADKVIPNSWFNENSKG